MSDLPSYYHLSSSQIDELSFRVTLRQARGSGEDPSGDVLLWKDIAWQEKIGRTTDDRHRRICIFTYLNADAIPLDVSLNEIVADDLQVITLGCRLSSKSERHQRAKTTLHPEKNDRLLREDSCQLMVIMANIGAHSSTHPQDVVLCVMKLYPQTGMVSSCPAWSEVETDCTERSSVFMSKRSVEEALDNGARLTTYSFILAGSIYEYSIEWNGARSIGDETELMIDKQHIIDNEFNDERRDLIRKEFDQYDCMYEKNETWNNQAHIELVSANGFSVPNFLLCMPHGPSIEVRYKITNRGDQYQKNGDVVLTGATASVQRYSAVHESLEFAAYFVAAYVCVVFALLLMLSYTGGDSVRSALLTIVPLTIIFNTSMIGKMTPWHINHQFTVLFKNRDDAQMRKDDIRRNDDESSLNLVLELHLYLKQNFGLISLAGCGTVALPTEPGTYDIVVKSWKPIAVTDIGESRARMHDFYLGSCLSEIGPLDPVPSSENEGTFVGDTEATLFSKGGLIADYSGNVHVRITVSRRLCKSSNWRSQEYPHNRVKMRETVDEVISRVRRNKRGRMSRVRTSSVQTNASSLNAPEIVKTRIGSNAPTRDETKYSINRKVSNRTAEVLERVRSRKS